MTSFQVTGGDQFADLARRLRKAGRRDLIKEIRKEIREEAQPAVLAARREVRALPARGRKHTRLRSRTAGAVRVQATGSTGIRIRVARSARLGLLPRHLNRGHWRKPLFGDRERWFDQTVPPGWFDRPMRESGPRVRRGIKAALDRTADRIAE